MDNSRYGDLIRLGPGDREVLKVLKRVPLGARTSEGGVSESRLRDLLFELPDTLPISAIDPAYDGAVPICKELVTAAGLVDSLYVNSAGRITLAEFKLWRNPDARREVIGQILDYAKELASWTYEDLERQVSNARPNARKEKGTNLFNLVDPKAAGFGESEFTDRVTKHLERGESLLLIVGDGIQEGVAKIIDFVQCHSGMHFTLALVEAALYRDDNNLLTIQPRVLAQTEIVQRFTIDSEVAKFVPEDDVEDPLSDQEEENLRFWSAVVQSYSFADTSVVVPSPSKDSTLYVPVRGSGWGDWAMCFDGYLQRKPPQIGCFLMARSNQSHAVRIFKDLASSMDELELDLGVQLELWNDRNGRPRLGFRKQGSLSFLVGNESDDDYAQSVYWMRDHLNRLVSVLHPRIQSMLDEGG